VDAVIKTVAYINPPPPPHPSHPTLPHLHLTHSSTPPPPPPLPLPSLDHNYRFSLSKWTKFLFSRTISVTAERKTLSTLGCFSGSLTHRVPLRRTTSTWCEPYIEHRSTCLPMCATHMKHHFYVSTWCEPMCATHIKQHFYVWCDNHTQYTQCTPKNQKCACKAPQTIFSDQSQTRQRVSSSSNTTAIAVPHVTYSFLHVF
jgi:hypothetical protein